MDGTPRPPTDATPRPPIPTDTPREIPRTVSLGDEIVGYDQYSHEPDIVVVIEEVDRSVIMPSIPPPEGLAYIAIRVTYRNLANHPWKITPYGDIGIEESRGFGVTRYIEDQTPSWGFEDELGVGVTESRWITYEVPASLVGGDLHLTVKTPYSSNHSDPWRITARAP
jgi:hypothetical protein